MRMFFLIAMLFLFSISVAWVSILLIVREFQHRTMVRAIEKRIQY